LAAYKTILIAGPTASGKSGLAIELAKRHNGVVINTDSMQVYSDLRVVTARPSLAEENQAPHRLYGFVDAATAFSTGAWLRTVTKLLPELRAEFRTLIFVGGTGLYFNALTAGLSEIPETPIELRQSLRDEQLALGSVALYAQLQIEDALSASDLKPTDGQRIVRALEVLRHTGRPLRAWQMETSTPLVDLASSETKAILLIPERDALAIHIAERFETMVARGALDEVEALISRKLDPLLPAMKAIGVKELGAYLAGEIKQSEAVNLAVIASRQYAKRQRTWFRGQMGDKWQRFDSANAAFEAVS
jgi:tRNA dimethylallyltransferase